MFELFGSSSEKKEEIDQNVEDIKDMVEGKEPPSQDNVPRTPQERAGGQQGPSNGNTGPQAEPIQAEGRQPPKTGQPQSTGQSPQQPDPTGQETQTGPATTPNRRQQPTAEQDGMTTTQHDTTGTQAPGQQQATETAGDDDLPPPPGQPQSTGQSPQQPDPTGQETQGQQARPRPEPEPAEKDSTQEPDDREDTRPSTDIPTAPETKEINVPEIEKGPLFIRVKKFKESKKLIHEMQDLTDDVETDMGGLKNTLEEDRDVRKDLKSRLKRLQDSMKSIHTIVSP